MREERDRRAGLGGRWTGTYVRTEREGCIAGLYHVASLRGKTDRHITITITSHPYMHRVVPITHQTLLHAYSHYPPASFYSSCSSRVIVKVISSVPPDREIRSVPQPTLFHHSPPPPFCSFLGITGFKNREKHSLTWCFFFLSFLHISDYCGALVTSKPSTAIEINKEQGTRPRI